MQEKPRWLWDEDRRPMVQRDEFFERLKLHYCKEIANQQYINKADTKACVNQ